MNKMMRDTIYTSLVLIALFFVMALLSGDSVARELLWLAGDRQEDTEAVKATVRRFNKKFADVYASGGARASLADFPGSTETRHEMFRDIGNLKMSGQLVVYDMADISVSEVEFISSRKAVAYVYEEWNYILQDSVSRKPLQNPRGLGADFRYELRRTDEGWSVLNYMPIRKDIDEVSH